MIKSFWWVPCVIVIYLVQGYSSFRNNENNTWPGWFYLIWIVNIVPLWAFVSKYSKNIMFDGFLYDILLFFSFYTAMLFAGGSSKIDRLGWAGVLLIMVGFVLLKVGSK